MTELQFGNLYISCQRKSNVLVELGLETFIQELISKWQHASRGMENEMVVVTDIITKNLLTGDIANLNEMLKSKGLQIVESESSFMDSALMDMASQKTNPILGYNLIKID